MNNPSHPQPKVNITNPLLRSRILTVNEVSLLEQYKHLDTTGRIGNFLRVLGKEEGTHEGYYFNDSDVYKWLEACAYGLKYGQSAQLKAAIDRCIDIIGQCQEPSGYLNTFFQLKHPQLKWRNTMMMHEMYCLGHLVEAAVAWFEETTGSDRRLLDIALKAVEEFASHFGPGKKLGYPGHEELELALFRLSDATGNSRWADLAGWMLDSRGSRPSPFELELEDSEALAISPWAERMLSKNKHYVGEYLQDHLPIREHTSVVGHAVRAMYLYIGATEWAIRTEDQLLTSALERVWNNLIQRRIYITGGIGPSGENEGFTTDYDLPNMTAYAESCAACALFWWASKMTRLTGEAKYLEVMEATLMNNVLACISLDGKKYFYDNPLESRGQHDRVEWFSCSCCPPNIAKMLLSLDRHIVHLTDDGISLNFLIDSEITAVFNGAEVKITVESNYPWSPIAKITVEPSEPVHFNLRVAWPVGSESVNIGTDLDFDSEQNLNEWFLISGKWQSGSEVVIRFQREPMWIKSHPLVLDNLGKVALRIGPIVYCCESADISVDEDEVTFQPIYPQHLRVEPDEDLEVVEEESPTPVSYVYTDCYCDVPMNVSPVDMGLVPQDSLIADDSEDTLYSPYDNDFVPSARVKLIPYFMWNNRGKSHMAVWLRVKDPSDDQSPSLN